MADALLSKLHRVKKSGADRWMACCPAHQDKTASLAVKALSDGRRGFAAIPLPKVTK